MGRLGFAGFVARLATRELVCIDEFELDDPGDQVFTAQLLAGGYRKKCLRAISRLISLANVGPASLIPSVT